MQNKNFYSVKHISGYNGWGAPKYGSTIKNFYNKQDAVDFCIANYKEEYLDGWPSIAIVQERIEGVNNAE